MIETFQDTINDMVREVYFEVRTPGQGIELNKENINTIETLAHNKAFDREQSTNQHGYKLHDLVGIEITKQVIERIGWIKLLVGDYKEEEK